MYSRFKLIVAIITFFAIAAFAVITEMSYAQESMDGNRFKNLAAEKKAALKAAQTDTSPPPQPRDIKLMATCQYFIIVVCEDNSIWSYHTGVAKEHGWDRLPGIPGR